MFLTISRLFRYRYFYIERLSLTSLWGLFWLNPERPVTSSAFLSTVHVCERSHNFLYPGKRLFAGSWRPPWTHNCWALTSSFSSLFLYPQVAGGLIEFPFNHFQFLFKPTLTQEYQRCCQDADVSLWVIMLAWLCDSQQEPMHDCQILQKIVKFSTREKGAWKYAARGGKTD